MKTTNTSVVAIYARVSTEEQRERQSIATQQEFGEKYCALHGFEVSGVYCDEGVSGTVPISDRLEGRRILADARQGRFGQLLVYKLDRLGRQARMILNTVDELEQLGVRVRSMTEDFDTGTATGMLLLTFLSGFAAHEREVIRERSVAGTKRLAQAGAWLGGIVPFGYRKQGEKREARLAIAAIPMPGFGLSEAEIVRSIYCMAVEDRLSCRAIADRLNAMGVPCAYARDERLLLRGKRRQRTSGIWRAGRVRNLITNPTYKGLHEYGKRSRGRDQVVIRREVPAIVTEDLWARAQAALASNFLFGARNAKHSYLLRGVMKCGHCGLTYIGTATTRPSGKHEFYYRCNGKHGSRQIFPAGTPRCSSRDLNGSQLEKLVWSDVERFLVNPGEVLELLMAKLSGHDPEPRNLARQPEQIAQLLSEKREERNRVLALYRRGRIDEASLETQLSEIKAEEDALERQRIESLQAKEQAGSVQVFIHSADDLLQRLRARLEQGISWDLKRELVETLVDGIEIETLENREAVVNVRYRFATVSLNCTDTRASFNCTLEKTYRFPPRRAA